MGKKYCTMTHNIGDIRTVVITKELSGAKEFLNFVSLPEDEIPIFIKEYNIPHDNILAFGKVDGTESSKMLSKIMPYCMLYDVTNPEITSLKTAAKVGKVRSYVCCNTDAWMDRIIHYDPVSAFKCVLNRLGNPKAILIYKELLQ